MFSVGETRVTNPKQRCPACEGSAVSDVQVANGYNIAQCGDCGLRFVSGARTGERLDYDALYSEEGTYALKLKQAVEGKGRLQRYARARRIALRRIRNLRPRSLLEVGCGVGRFLQHIETLGIECYGSDVSANAIEAARRLLSCPLHCGTLTEAAFPGLTVEVVCTWEVLEHVEDVESFMRSIFDRLDPGGYLFLSTPNYESRWVWEDMPHHPPSRPPVHLTFWTASSLTRFLSRMGFADVLVRRVSIPANCAARSGKVLARRLVYADALLRPRQRATLLARARRPVMGKLSYTTSSTRGKAG